MKHILTILFCCLVFGAMGQSKLPDSVKTYSVNDKIEYNPFGATTATTSTALLPNSIYLSNNSNHGIVFPKRDTVVRIYYIGKFLIISMSIKQGEYVQVAARDTDGTWVFHKDANQAMDIMYFSLLKIALIK